MPISLPYFYKIVESGTPDTSEARRRYLQRCSDFAMWDGPELDDIVIDLAIGAETMPAEYDEHSTPLLDYVRDLAYRERVLKACVELLDRDDVPDFDPGRIDDFVDEVMSNWDDAPLESHDNGLEGQRDAVVELWEWFVGRTTSEPKIDGLDDDTLAQLREATTTLAGVKATRDVEAEEKAATLRVYKEIGADLKQRMEALFRQINDVAAMLWNARFPDHTLPNGFEIYTWSGHQSGGHITPPFDPGPGHRAWDRNPLSLWYSRNVWVNHEGLRAVKPGMASTAFKLTTSEGDGHHGFMLCHSGEWSFGHNANWARRAGGVTSIRELTAVLSERLAAQ